MNADLQELKNEINFIKNKVGEDNYRKLHSEFDKDNDYQSIQKIKSAYQTLGYSKTEEEVFFSEIKELFIEDNKIHPIEEGLFLVLKKIIKN